MENGSHSDIVEVRAFKPEMFGKKQRQDADIGRVCKRVFVVRFCFSKKLKRICLPVKIVREKTDNLVCVFED